MAYFKYLNAANKLVFILSICYFIGYHCYALSLFNFTPFLFIDTLQTGSWPFNSLIYVSSLYLLYMVFSQMYIELGLSEYHMFCKICIKIIFYCFDDFPYFDTTAYFCPFSLHFLELASLFSAVEIFTVLLRAVET